MKAKCWKQLVYNLGKVSEKNRKVSFAPHAATAAIPVKGCKVASKLRIFRRMRLCWWNKFWTGQSAQRYRRRAVCCFFPGRKTSLVCENFVHKRVLRVRIPAASTAVQHCLAVLICPTAHCNVSPFKIYQHTNSVGFVVSRRKRRPIMSQHTAVCDVYNGRRTFRCVVEHMLNMPLWRMLRSWPMRMLPGCCVIRCCTLVSGLLSSDD